MRARAWCVGVAVGALGGGEGATGDESSGTAGDESVS
jgi:hypothetical protein